MKAPIYDLHADLAAVSLLNRWRAVKGHIVALRERGMDTTALEMQRDRLARKLDIAEAKAAEMRIADCGPTPQGTQR